MTDPPHRRLPYSDLDLSRWRELSGEIETGSLWLFPSRDKHASHAGDYHGNFIPQVAQQLLKRYTREGDAVLDMFMGMGTSLIECRLLGRHGIGVELLPSVAERARERIEAAPNPFGTQSHIVEGSSADPKTAKAVAKHLKALGKSHADLAILHPPYSDIISFSQGEHPEDLSNVDSDDDFVARFSEVAQRSFELLAPGRFMGLVIGDKYAKGEWIPLGFYCMQACMAAGYRLKSIVVKDINGNERGKGKNTNLWKYRALANGIYVFKHEYVMVFQKPKG